MFNLFKKKSENDIKIELCKDFVTEITDNNFSQNLLNKTIYEQDYFSTYEMEDNIPLIVILSVLLLLFTPIYWSHNPETFSNLWFSIPYFFFIFLLYIYFIFVKGNEETALSFVKNILANIKIKKFTSKYFSNEDKTITIFKFLKHSKFDSFILDKLLHEALTKRFTYNTIESLENHLISYKQSQMHEKINGNQKDQSIDFLHQNTDQDIQFFSKVKKQ